MDIYVNKGEKLRSVQKVTRCWQFFRKKKSHHLKFLSWQHCIYEKSCTSCCRSTYIKHFRYFLLWLQLLCGLKRKSAEWIHHSILTGWGKTKQNKPPAHTETERKWHFSLIIRLPLKSKLSSLEITVSLPSHLILLTTPAQNLLN